eukprot:gene41245-43983_t
MSIVTLFPWVYAHTLMDFPCKQEHFHMLRNAPLVNTADGGPGSCNLTAPGNCADPQTDPHVADLPHAARDAITKLTETRDAITKLTETRELGATG